MPIEQADLQRIACSSNHFHIVKCLIHLICILSRPILYTSYFMDIDGAREAIYLNNLLLIFIITKQCQHHNMNET